MPIKVVFLDCDGTLTTVKSSWEYLHRRLNLWTENADVYQALFRQGKIDYNEFCKRDALLWKNLPVSSVLDLINDIPYQENVSSFIGALKKMGIYTVIISSGLSLLVDSVRGEFAIDMAFSNELVSQEGFLTGDIKINVEYNMKGPLVGHMLEVLGFKKEEASAVGDGDGDRGMFDAVALPIHFAVNGSSAAGYGHAITARALNDVVSIIKKYA